MCFHALKNWTQLVIILWKYKDPVGKLFNFVTQEQCSVITHYHLKVLSFVLASALVHFVRVKSICFKWRKLISVYPVKLQLQAVGFYSLSPPLWGDHNTMWEQKILPAVCTSKFSIPTKLWSNDQSLERKKQGTFLLFHWLFSKCVIILMKLSPLGL